MQPNMHQVELHTVLCKVKENMQLTLTTSPTVLAVLQRKYTVCSTYMEGGRGSPEGTPADMLRHACSVLHQLKVPNIPSAQLQWGQELAAGMAEHRLSENLGCLAVNCTIQLHRGCREESKTEHHQTLIKHNC